MEATYAYFYDSENDVEVVYRYPDRSLMEIDFDLINYNCAKHGVQDYSAYEIDVSTAFDLVTGGVKYAIRFADGAVACAFEDELTPTLNKR